MGTCLTSLAACCAAADPIVTAVSNIVTVLKSCCGESTNDRDRRDQELLPPNIADNKGTVVVVQQANVVNQQISSSESTSDPRKLTTAQEESRWGTGPAKNVGYGGPSSGGNGSEQGERFFEVELFEGGVTHYMEDDGKTISHKYWKYNIATESRFRGHKVLEQKGDSIYFFHIEAKLNFRDLPLPNTTYGIYFIFKKSDGWKGLDTSLEASVTVENDNDVVLKTVYLKPPKKKQNIDMAVQRRDGWMELELGRFFCDDNTRDQEVKVVLKDPKNDTPGIKEKRGLIIAGIELRPVDPV